MDQTKIQRFLSIAKNEVGVGVPTVSGDDSISGTKSVPPFTQGNLTYKISFGGFETFFIKETITHKGKVAWNCYSNGGVIDKTLPKTQIIEIYSFLKNALTKCPNSRPEQRGPKNYEEGLFDYKNTFEGNFEKFKGKEEIFLKGKKVYELTYHS